MRFKSRVTVPAVATISFFLIGETVPAPAYADVGDQLFKLLPDDGAAFARFGSSVAISGDIAIVGARNDENFSGSAYLFDVSDPKNPVQIAKLKANDSEALDEFGHAIAISASIVIISAPENGDNGSLSGSAYLFDISDPKNPVQIAKLLPNDGAAGDYFGGTVAIFGATALVGASGNDDNGKSTGSAYLFDISDPANPVQTAKLLAADGAMGDSFGWGTAISGGIAVIGALGQDDNGELSGCAYLFDISAPANPVQTAKLLPDDGATGDRFGRSIAISGATIIVGAYLSGSGSAYLFDISDPNNPVQIAKLLPDDGTADDRFGGSVAINGTTAIVGSNAHNDNGADSGSAYLFDITDAKNLVQIAKLLPNDGATDDQFGISVAIHGDTAIIGAYLDDDNGNKSGSAYLFSAPPPVPCPWDLDDNGFVGASDLLSLLVTWGGCAPCIDCPADFDHNCNVGATDLLALLVNWGPCP